MSISRVMAAFDALDWIASRARKKEREKEREKERKKERKRTTRFGGLSRPVPSIGHQKVFASI